MGGLLGKAPEVNGVKVAGGPQMYPALARRQAAVCHHLAVLHLGQPVLSRDPHAGRCHADDRLRRRERRHEDQRGLHRRFRQGAATGPAAATRPATPAATAPATSGCDRDAHHHARQPRRRDLQVDARRPLLDTLREQGVDLPYGCRYGGCITCAARLTAGEIDQRRQVALNNRQIN